MLFYYLFTCLSCFFFLSSLPLKPLPIWFWKDLPFTSIYRCIRKSMHNTCFWSMKMKTYTSSSKSKVGEEDLSLSILDLPDLALECILEKLPPAELCNTSRVCTSLRERCTSDHLWERHMKSKWERVIGSAAYREWQWHIAYVKESGNLELTSKSIGLEFIRLFSSLWPFRSFSEVYNGSSGCNKKTIAPFGSTMSWYLALENGNFWFPAQVYNRENGHVGFLLSCYDADLIYDSCTDTFQARYPPHGRRAIAVENGVSWDRLRAPPNNTSPLDLYHSNCLNQLRPGDHIEIQWRRNKGFPYGWWYGVVDHLDSCDGNSVYCLCHESDDIKLLFCQYTEESRWRSTIISRKDHEEKGDDERAFMCAFGGVTMNKVVSSTAPYPFITYHHSTHINGTSKENITGYLFVLHLNIYTFSLSRLPLFSITSSSRISPFTPVTEIEIPQTTNLNICALWADLPR